MIILHWACTLISIASKHEITYFAQKINCRTIWLLEICTSEYKCYQFLYLNYSVGREQKIQEYLMINVVFFSFYKDLKIYFYIIYLFGIYRPYLSN